MSEEKAAVVATTAPTTGDSMQDGAEEDFVKIKDDEDMPEASNAKTGGLFGVLGRVSNQVGSTWSSLKAKEGTLGNVTRTADGFFTTVIEKGKEVDGKLGVTTKVKSAAGTVKDTTVSLNEKYHVTETVKGVAASAGQTVGNLNEKYHVSERVKGAVNTGLDKVGEVDKKLAFSSTLNATVNAGFATVISAVRPGQGVAGTPEAAGAPEAGVGVGSATAAAAAEPGVAGPAGGKAPTPAEDPAEEGDEKPKAKADGN